MKVPPFRITLREGGCVLLGQLVFSPNGRERAERHDLYGLGVLQVRVRPGGWREKGRLRRSGKRLAQGGVRRVLVPEHFDQWPLLERWDLRPVDPVPFLRFHAPQIVLAALNRREIAPECATVALRGKRVDRDMARCAQLLCPLVRQVAVNAPQGGEELSSWLRREYGLPVQPDGTEVSLAVYFDGEGAEEKDLLLWGTAPQLGEVIPQAEALAPQDRQDLCLLAALWETGKIGKFELEFT